MVTITVRSDLSRIQRPNLETCITVHMHQKESTEDLVRRKVGPAPGFCAWQRGTGFALRPWPGTVLRMGDAGQGGWGPPCARKGCGAATRAPHLSLCRCDA